ncbi:MAG: sigma-70 family RNA polymerase sigma factor [Planctomycetia bacterium]|nr:sigma-70 family RNA polymerase sigma factor [Planctomycetia bacterium]
MSTATCDAAPAPNPQQLFDANVRLAYHVAQSFQSAADRAGIDRDDLRQAARLGLWQSCQRFDASLGWKFSTYAYVGVQNHCRRLLYTARRQRGEWALPQDLRQHDGLSVLDLAADRRDDHDRDRADDQAAARERLRPLLAALPERLRLVLTLRHGLDGEGERTLEDVGRVLGVTRERVRQLEHDAYRWVLRARRVATERAAGASG